MLDCRHEAWCACHTPYIPTGDILRGFLHARTRVSSTHHKLNSFRAFVVPNEQVCTGCAIFTPFSARGAQQAFFSRCFFKSKQDGAFVIFRYNGVRGRRLLMDLTVDRTSDPDISIFFWIARWSCLFVLSIYLSLRTNKFIHTNLFIHRLDPRG